MFASFLPMALAAAIGQQAPADAAWLKQIPADAAVVMHIRGATATRDDLLAMIKAMSPTLSNQVAPTINGAFESVPPAFQGDFLKGPVVFALKLPFEDEPDMAILASVEDGSAVAKAIASGPGGAEVGEPKKLDGGYMLYEGNEKVYYYQGDGYAAFGPKEGMIKAIASKPSDALAAKLPADVTAKLFAGDVGAYVDLESVVSEYGEQIDGAREQFMAMLDQAGGQLAGGQMEQAKEIYGALFDAIEQGQSLTVSIDVGAEGLMVSSLVKVKEGSEVAKTFSEGRVGAASKLGDLPADSLMYVYMNANPDTMQRFQAMGINSNGMMDMDSPEMKQAMETLKAAGPQEAYGAMSFGAGMSMLNVAYPEDAAKALAAAKMMTAATSKSPMFKSVKVEEKAQDYKGTSMTKVTMTLDMEKLMAAQPNNPAAEQMMKSMFGGDTITTWVGSDGERTLSVMAKDWDAAKAKLDSFSDGKGIGAAAGFESLRGMLPKEAGAYFMVNSQEMVKQVGQLVSGIAGADLQPPADMPKATALFGMAFSTSADGMTFDFVLPSANGAVIEKGLVPMFQGMAGQVNQ